MCALHFTMREHEETYPLSPSLKGRGTYAEIRDEGTTAFTSGGISGTAMEDVPPP